MNSSGSGTIANAMNPSTELPHPSPKSLYNGAPARGKSAPTRDLKTVLAAVTEAAYRG